MRTLRKVLLLEDDAVLRSEIAEALEDESFTVRQSGTIASFWQEFRRFEPEVSVVDLNLPDGRGADVVRDLRIFSSVGILVLSGRQDEADRVIALEMGADDFIVKPCGPRELIARINAILRRLDPIPASDTRAGARRVVSFAGYELDFSARELRGPDGGVCPLTTAEFDLLRVFVERPQRVLSRNQLLDLVRGENWAGYDRAIDGLVSRLRKKLSCPELGEPMFKTVHGVGYMFVQPVS